SRGGGGRGGLRVDQRGFEALPRRAVRRLQAIRRRTRRRDRRTVELHAREEHPHQPEAARRRALRGVGSADLSLRAFSASVARPERRTVTSAARGNKGAGGNPQPLTGRGIATLL